MFFLAFQRGGDTIFFGIGSVTNPESNMIIQMNVWEL